MSKKRPSGTAPANLTPIVGATESGGASPIEMRSISDGHLIIGIGASAGGIEAFRSFFSEMPVDSGMAFVLVQHLDPDYNSALADIISDCTEMPVKKATEAVNLLRGLLGR